MYSVFDDISNYGQIIDRAIWSMLAFSGRKKTSLEWVAGSVSTLNASYN